MEGAGRSQIAGRWPPEPRRPRGVPFHRFPPPSSLPSPFLPPHPPALLLAACNAGRGGRRRCPGPSRRERRCWCRRCCWWVKATATVAARREGPVGYFGPPWGGLPVLIDLDLPFSPLVSLCRVRWADWRHRWVFWPLMRGQGGPPFFLPAQPFRFLSSSNILLPPRLRGAGATGATGAGIQGLQVGAEGRRRVSARGKDGLLPVLTTGLEKVLRIGFLPAGGHHPWAWGVCPDAGLKPFPILPILLHRVRPGRTAQPVRDKFSSVIAFLGRGGCLPFLFPFPSNNFPSLQARPAPPAPRA